MGGTKEDCEVELLKPYGTQAIEWRSCHQTGCFIVSRSCRRYASGPSPRISFAFAAIHCPSLMTGGVDRQYMGLIRTFRTPSEFQSSLGIITSVFKSKPEFTIALSRPAIPNPKANKAPSCLRDVFHATRQVAAASSLPILSAFAPQYEGPWILPRISRRQ